MKHLLAFVCMVILCSSFSHAAVTINVVESDGDVVATATGGLNLTGASGPFATGFFGAKVIGSASAPAIKGLIMIGPVDSPDNYVVTGGGAFAIGGAFSTFDNSGSIAIGVATDTTKSVFYVSQGYVSGTQISSSSTWASTTLSAMGLVPGTYVYTWSGDSITLNIGGVTPPPLACTMYTDRATFEAAAPGLPTEDFESTSAVAEFDSPLDENTDVPPYIAPGDILPGVAFLNPDFVQRLRLFDTEFARMIPDGISLSDSGNDTDSLVVTLNPAVSAFGFDIFSETDSASVRIYNANSDLIGSYDGSAPQTGGFLGCISADPVARVVLSAPANASGNLEALDNVSFGEPSVAPVTYTVGGAVTGLAGSVTLQNNGTDDLVRNVDGSFTFVTALVDSSAYAVTVLTQPTGQTCTVANGSGTISAANVTNVAVACVTDVIPTYSVGGTVTGLTGTGLALQNNDADTLPVAADGSFTFATELTDGAAYAVTVSTQPTGQTCSVATGSGAISAANVTNVAVTCVTDVIPTYSVGGTVTGLTGTGLALQNNGADTLAVAVDGPFTFATELTDGAAYAITVSAQPTGQTCSVSNGSGTIATGDVTDADVTCVDDVVPPAPAVPIPTMSEWALILFSMLLGLMVFINRRRLF